MLIPETVQALDTADYYAPHIQLSMEYRDKLQQV